MAAAAAAAAPGELEMNLFDAVEMAGRRPIYMYQAVATQSAREMPRSWWRAPGCIL
jgi:hypothetical protein